ncbi:MAG: MerR family transcriptional regulator [Lachnospiraceae bacterium]|nr:MerR family transcriptional regulator [Lachnospiraceae bacterium]
MGYKVKWVEENLGVSRKALRNFEKHGLMPANEGGAYRDYSDEDIERIWAIRLFQGMGYTLKELVKLSESDDFDFDASLEKKIQELENEKAKIERHLGYAQHIKLTGRFPSRPKNMGTITFEEFQEKSLNQWNVNSDPEAKKYQEIADLVLNTPEDELKDTDIGRLFEFLIELQEQMSDMDSLFIEKVIPNEIIKRIENGPEDEEVQLLVKMMYENRISSISDMAKSQFVRFESSSYISGDIARMHEKEYGKDGCRFIADAIAVFGGYSCYDEVED